MRNTTRIYEELCLQNYEEDASITEYNEVFSIDAGAHFIDDAKQKHNDACFWLSVHCALHFASINKRLPHDLDRALHQHKLLPAILKAKSGCQSLTERVDEKRHIEPLCRFLGISIVVYVKGIPQCYGSNTRFVIELWLSQCHYTVLICRKGSHSEHAVTRAVEFASEFAGLGYEAGYLNPLEKESDNYKIAITLNSEWTKSYELEQEQIRADEELALQLQSGWRD